MWKHLSQGRTGWVEEGELNQKMRFVTEKAGKEPRIRASDALGLNEGEERGGAGLGGRQLPQGPRREGPPALGPQRSWCARGAGRPAVDALVAQHVLAAPEALAALPAGERPRARVRLAVAHQVLAPVEGFAALAAGVRLLTGGQRAQGWPGDAGVRAAVATQVLLAPEGLAALRAGVRLLARVALPVPRQVRRLQGGLAALRAGHGACGGQEGGQAGRGQGRRVQLGAVWLLLVGACGLGVLRGGLLSPWGSISCRAKAQSGRAPCKAERTGPG